MSNVISARRLVWLVPALGLLAACSEKKPAQQMQTPSAAAESAATAAPAPPPPVSATLAEMHRSHITGNVTLTQKGDSTEVAETLTGGRPGTKYPTHIHSGTCAKPGAVVQPLESVAVGTDKSGSATTMVLTATIDSARTKFGSLLIQSHNPRGMQPVACAELPAK
jgi:hypothetical protein